MNVYLEPTSVKVIIYFSPDLPTVPMRPHKSVHRTYPTSYVSIVRVCWCQLKFSKYNPVHVRFTGASAVRIGENLFLIVIRMVCRFS